MSSTNRKGGEARTQAVLFCVGLGCSDAWWLCASTAAITPAGSATAAWIASLLLHGSYLVVQLACFFAASILGSRLATRPVSLGLGALIALFSGGIALVSSESQFWGLAALFLAVAAAGNALLFLGWMRRFSLMGDGVQAPLSLMLCSMACGSVLWVVAGWLPSAALVMAMMAFPLASALLLSRRPQRSQETVHFVDGAPAFKLLPPLFLAGIFIYELAPGLVTSMVHIGGMADVYRLYALGMVVLAAASFFLKRRSHVSQVVFRLVAPIISLGLIASALVSAQESGWALSATLIGSMLFEAFLFTRFAEVAARGHEEPVRVFALGGLAAQLGIAVAYALVPLLAESVQVTIASLALVVVFLLVLSGAFFSGDPKSAGSGLMEEGRVPSPDQFRSDCRAFSDRHGLSKREAEVFELAMQGKNQGVIAKELFVAETTVKTHLRSIYRKTGTANRQELIALFLEYRNAEPSVVSA